MLGCMRTTIRLRDDLLRRARRRALDEGRTLTALIDEALTLALTAPRAPRRKPVRLPTSRARGGLLPGVDLDRSADLEALMDEP